MYQRNNGQLPMDSAEDSDDDETGPRERAPITMLELWLTTKSQLFFPALEDAEVSMPDDVNRRVARGLFQSASGHLGIRIPGYCRTSLTKPDLAAPITPMKYASPTENGG